MSRAWICLLAGLVNLACGSRTGLGVRDAGPPAPPRVCPYQAGAQAGAPWPMFGRCPDHRALSPAVGPRTAHVRWTAPLGDPNVASPVIGADGTIYVGAGHSLHAVAPDGAERWAFATMGTIAVAPAIDQDGTIYACANDGQLYALSDAGELRWALALTDPGSQRMSAPTIGYDGAIYVSTASGLCAIDADGSLRWRYVPDGNAGIGGDGTPAIGADV